jgi:hypothetical protein
MRSQLFVFSFSFFFLPFILILPKYLVIIRANFLHLASFVKVVQVSTAPRVFRRLDASRTRLPSARRNGGTRRWLDCAVKEDSAQSSLDDRDRQDGGMELREKCSCSFPFEELAYESMVGLIRPTRMRG